MNETHPDLPGSVYKTNNSLYCLLPEKLRQNQLFFVKAHDPYVISTVTETEQFVDIIIRFKKKKQVPG